MQTNPYYFPYTQEETRYLSEADPKLGKYIEEYGYLQRKVEPDIFFALIESIVAQQISGKAADTIFSRVKEALDEITPQSILDTDVEVLRTCGISQNKAKYMKSAAEFFFASDETYESMREKSDEELISLLTQIKGVGVWTAEMLLIFSFGRKDILSYNDFAIRKGLKILHGLSELKQEEYGIYKNMYSPYASIASFYLWEIAGS